MAGRIIVFATLASLLIVGTTAAESKSFELLKLDLHCPRNDATLKPGWAGWRVPGGRAILNAFRLVRVKPGG